jgi:hypothetical protein
VGAGAGADPAATSCSNMEWLLRKLEGSTTELEPCSAKPPHHVRPLGEAEGAICLLAAHLRALNRIDGVLDAAGEGDALVADVTLCTRPR